MSAVSPRVATHADVEAVAETLTLAFRADPVWGPYSFPDPQRQVEQSRRLWAAFAQAAMRFPWTLVTPRCEAVAVWIPPSEPELTEEQEAEFEALAVDVLGVDQAGVVLGALGALDEHHPQDEPHYYLSLLATHDHHRGRGLGMALLAACLERVDAERMPAYLESTNPANDARYQRLGFEPYGTITLANGHVVTTMWREPA
ncbi:MAG TPA: GNAT family N-acetyltransferase [Gaiellales bacterium]|jgi:GNAT superfamily N-acetyltransferase